MVKLKYKNRGWFEVGPDGEDLGMIAHAFPNPAVRDELHEYIVEAVNDHARLLAEIERYEKLFAHQDFAGFEVWSYHPINFDEPVKIDQFAKSGKWTWFHEHGKVLPDAPLFDTALEAFEALTANRPQEQSAQEAK